MWVEEGHIRSPMTASRGFEWKYRLNITLTDCTTHPSVLFLAINDWLRVNQPDLISNATSEGYKFEADIIDTKSVDLHITLHLTEQVALVDDGEGGFALQHLAEPDLSWLTGAPSLSTPTVDLVRIIASPIPEAP